MFFFHLSIIHIVGNVSNTVLDFLQLQVEFAPLGSSTSCESLFFIGIKPIHITSSKFFYIQQMFLYSKCIMEFFVIEVF
jgi:hypothetical protein